LVTSPADIVTEDRRGAKGKIQYTVKVGCDGLLHGLLRKESIKELEPVTGGKGGRKHLVQFIAPSCCADNRMFEDPIRPIMDLGSFDDRHVQCFVENVDE
jgi:hypothetical protein